MRWILASGLAVAALSGASVWAGVPGPDLLTQDPGAYALVVDSLLAAGDTSGVSGAAAAYLEAAGDSLLLWDAGFTAGADAAARRTWWDAVVADAQGLALRGAKDFAGSAERFRAAALGYAEAGHLRREAVAWGSLGVSLWSTGDWAAVLEAYQKALETRRRLGDAVLVGRTLNALGSTYMRLADYPSALRYYDEAREVRETLGNAADLGTTLAYIGNVHYLMGNLVEARAEYVRSLEVFGPQAPPAQRRYSLMGLGGVHLALGEYEEGLDYYRRALILAEEVGDGPNADVCRQNMGEILRIRGEYAEALRELEAARAAQEAREDWFNLGLTWNVMGEVYMSQGDDPRALQAQQTAVRLSREAGNKKVLGEALESVGFTYHRMGLYDRALETLAESKAVLEEGGNRGDVASVLDKTAMVHETQGNYEEALGLYRQALALQMELGNLGMAAGERGNVANVLDALNRSDEALVEYRIGVDLAEELGQKDMVWRCLLGMANVHEHRGDLDSARVYNDRAIDVMESLRGSVLSEDTKASFLAAGAYVYEAQVHVLAGLDAARGGYAETALAVAERGKAQALLDVLAEGRVDIDAGFDAALVAERKDLERSMNAVRYRLRMANEGGVPPDSVRTLKKRLAVLESEHAALRERLRLANPRLGSMESGAVWSLEAIRHTLLADDKTVLLVYALGDSASYGWRVTKRDLELRRLPPRGELAALTEKLRSGLTNPQPSGDVALLDAAAALHAALLAPFGEDLRKARRVMVVPDGALHRVPFEVLLERPLAPPADPATRSDFFAGLPYAFRDAEVSYGPSATVLGVLAGSRPPDAGSPARDLLAVGDPLFTRGEAASGLAPLPHTREEARHIAALYPADRVTVLLGEDAAEATLSAPGFLDGYRILHFATHGLIDERRPENSSLALSVPRDPSEDGYLQAREIFDFHLRADLVVLSACETGLGKEMRGEGVLGLPRAFFHAGVPRVLVSLWSVSDRSTAELMTFFYKELEGGGKGGSPAGALGGAKRALRAEATFSHPFYWAPFVLLGPG